VRLAGHAVRYEASGDGPVVVLVHGLGGSARWWRGTAASLARTHRVIVPELPGFGYGLSGRRFRLVDAPVVLGGLLERLGVGRVALVCHSFGALVCLGVAAALAGRVDRLVLVGPPVRPASPALAGNLLPVARTLLRLPPAAALTVVTDIATRSPAALLRAAGEILAHGGEPAVTAPPVPTMVVWGARDALVPLGRAGWVSRALPEARLSVIPGAGHVPMLDRPAAFTAVLEDFLGPGGRAGP
jgi:pimeloyl-ACP methyl ester carboxylesterase